MNSNEMEIWKEQCYFRNHKSYENQVSVVEKLCKKMRETKKKNYLYVSIDLDKEYETLDKETLLQVQETYEIGKKKYGLVYSGSMSVLMHVSQSF